jgi:hypothetical protein
MKGKEVELISSWEREKDNFVWILKSLKEGEYFYIYSLLFHFSVAREDMGFKNYWTVLCKSTVLL